MLGGMAAYRHVDGRTLCLGKNPPVIDPRTLKLEKYVYGLGQPPASVDYAQGITNWGMMLNGNNSYGNGVPSDGLGDCTCAMAGHGVQVARLNSPSGIVTPPDATIEQLYQKACGYVPGNESSDQGGYILNVLNWVRQNPPWSKKKRYAGTGHKHPWQLLAYADPEAEDFVSIQWSIDIFQAVGIGLQLPITAQAQVGGLWEVTGNPNLDHNAVPGSWGGHAIIICGYKFVNGVLWLLGITWGQLQWMTQGFWSAYVDEAHALLYRARVDTFGVKYPKAMALLKRDLKAITGG
jgi:hypothetical protein